MTQYKPEEFPIPEGTILIIGCDTESPRKVWYNKEDFIREAVDHAYICFVDKSGDVIREVKVMDWQEGVEGDSYVLETSY